MKKYIAMLRGINVSGQKLIKMAELKTLLEESDFDNITTYIQSGNVLFNSRKTDQNELAGLISDKIKQKYGFDVPVIVISKEELKHLSVSNPFINEHQIDIERLYVTFLDKVPMPDLVDKFKEVDYKPDEFFIIGKYLYGYFPNGYGNSKFSNNFIESKLKVTATTRNWKTVMKLLEMTMD